MIYQVVTTSVLFVVLCLLLIGQHLLWGGSVKFREPVPKSYDDSLNRLEVSCTNVSQEMTRGHWVQNNFTLDQLQEIEDFLSRTRAYHKFPAGLQRDDMKCGDVNFPGLWWGRAVCNPSGSTPCCWEKTCVAKSVEHCRCPRCYDMRQQIHAELATWVPDNPRCQVKLLSRQEVCLLLANLTIYFVGDSLMRQVALSVLGLLRDDVLMDNTPRDMQAKCDRYYMYFSECSGVIQRDTHNCGRKVRLKIVELWSVSQIANILEAMGELSGKNNSLFVFGIGMHDGLDHELILTKVLNPIFELMSMSPWPKVIWMTPHAPGLLKSGLNTAQQSDHMKFYNRVIRGVMEKRGVPVVDFFNLTEGVMSYDGTHFGKGLNDVKAHIFVNFLLENRKYLVDDVLDQQH
ncbi:uncharacterized protein LOC131930126 [Physella acuta]|uniref:uncharacterized protein LOC131930126 n=1 Tax=Physella acuta TaxID=109671 RepID=UPI0027DC26FA|nr:uncharacterized protein LOC131930126 [Physella acuta]